MKTEDIHLNLSFRPFEAVLSEADMSFVERYGKRYYPKAMSELAKQLHAFVATVTRKAGPGLFEYQLHHYTNRSNKRYVIEESLRDPTADSGFSIGIQATTHEERKMFLEAVGENANPNATQPIANIVAYLEDILDRESHKWTNSKLHNGQDALPLMQELIGFLKSIKNQARVYHFNLNDTPEGMELSIALATPGVVAYYTRIDWIIV